MIEPLPARSANLLTIDVEDWYQLVGESLTGADDAARPAVVERQLVRALELLARHRCRATFFCLGRSLVNAPHLVRLIASAGHELGTHGWSHRWIFETGLDAFREDLRRSVVWLSDLTGRAVLGHRAPAFSVRPEQLEGFFDIAFEAGLRYDSSVFPFRGRRYGIPTAPRGVYIVRANGARKLVEFPLATVELAGRRWPVAGGGWWRVLPAWAIGAAVKRLEREGLPFMTYLHPYEFDAERLDARAAGGRGLRARRLNLTANLGRSSVYSKLDRLLGRFRFMAVEDYLNASGCL